MGLKNICIIVVDSLRYDTTQIADYPNLKSLFIKYGMGSNDWVKAYTNGTYTLPVHISLFKSGHLPSNEIDNVHKVYTRRNNFRIFNPTLSWNKKRDVLFPTPNASSIVNGFHKLGYRTIGIGGVDWFNNTFETSNIWNEFFNEFYWQWQFSSIQFDGFEKQINLIRSLNISQYKPLFFFLNISSTHRPCRGDQSIQGQAKALSYVDTHITKVIDELPRPCFTIVMSDHGTLFNDDNVMRGHGFYHPRIIEVPIIMMDMKI